MTCDLYFVPAGHCVDIDSKNALKFSFCHGYWKKTLWGIHAILKYVYSYTVWKYGSKYFEHILNYRGLANFLKQSIQLFVDLESNLQAK